MQTREYKSIYKKGKARQEKRRVYNTIEEKGREEKRREGKIHSGYIRSYKRRAEQRREEKRREEKRQISNIRANQSSREENARG